MTMVNFQFQFFNSLLSQKEKQTTKYKYNVSIHHIMLSDKKEHYPVLWKKNVCKVQKKQISLHPANTRRRPPLGQRWANVGDGGPALAQHRDNVPCLLGIHDILPISKKLNKVIIQ